MLGELNTSKTRLRLLIKFFISQANKGYLNGLATEMGEATNAIRKELNHLQGAGYLDKIKVDNKVEYINLANNQLPVLPATLKGKYYRDSTNGVIIKILDVLLLSSSIMRVL